MINPKEDGLGYVELLEKIRKCNPRILGISSMTHEVYRAAKLSKIVKSSLPETLIVIGEAHSTALPKLTLEEFPSFDISCFGEGEETMVELFRAINEGNKLNSIRGIACRKKGQITVNEPRPFIMDLDSLPFPEWSFFPRKSHYPIYSARGCPFNCNFCMRVLG